VVAEIEAAWAQPQADWTRRRLLVVRLIAQHELTVAEIMRVADISRQTLFTYRDKVVVGGVSGLLTRGKAPGNQPALNSPEFFPEEGVEDETNETTPRSGSRGVANSSGTKR
jgi:hypothetical protein